MSDRQAEDRIVPLTGSRADWLTALETELYGPIPEARNFTLARAPLPDAHAERLTLHFGGFAVDAGLWLPENPRGLIIALDFLGPVGSLTSEAFPLDLQAIVALPPWHGGGSGPLDDSVRGTSLHRIPIDLILDAGWGVLTACYGSFVPDHQDHWASHGLKPLLGADTGAISLWAWALMRLVDAGQQLGFNTIALAGHSRLGKAALWAAANDERVSAVLSNDSGCGGASLEAHKAGETLEDMRSRFPHWLVPKTTQTADQHMLLAAIAPRSVYVASAIADDWADPIGEYMALQWAAKAWGSTLPELEFRAGASRVHGKLGWHLRQGGHELLPYDWRRYLAFLESAAP
jgi:hypothetical protein